MVDISAPPETRAHYNWVMLRRDKDSEFKEDKKDRALRELSSAIWHDAQAAHGAGQQFFSFLWILADATFIFGGMIQRQDYRSPDQLVGEIERLGWRLESTDTVLCAEVGRRVLGGQPCPR